MKVLLLIHAIGIFVLAFAISNMGGRLSEVEKNTNDNCTCKTLACLGYKEDTDIFLSDKSVILNCKAQHITEEDYKQ